MAFALFASCAPRRIAFDPVARALDIAIADSVITTDVAPGAKLHRIVSVKNPQAPWRAFVLDVDLRCATVHAMKGSATSVGRTTTSGLLASLPGNSGAIATLNADFFAFAPPGVPTNLHVERGVLFSGPGGKPVVTVRDGRLAIDSLEVRGQLTRGDRVWALHSWNRPSAARAGIVDARWGIALDTTVRGRVWRLEPVAGYRARVGEQPAQLAGRFVVRTAQLGDTLVAGDTLLLHLPTRVRIREDDSNSLRAGDTVHLRLGLERHGHAVAVTEAVGGRPIVLADSTITADVHTEGNDGFRNLNPRSALGLDRSARRAWFAVIDGRQPGYSMGMTLQQVGALMQALGATHALNLDGGGSSALAVRAISAGGLPLADRVVNRPSDPTERPVGNALAVFSTCR